MSPTRQELAPSRRWIARAIWVASVGFVAADLVLVALGARSDTFSPVGQSGFLDGAVAVGMSSFATVGLVLGLGRPGHRIGMLLQAIGLGGAVASLSTTYASFGLFISPGAVPGSEIMAWLANWIFLPFSTLILILVPLLFPDGRLPSPRWRILVGIAVAGAALGVVGAALLDGPLFTPFQTVRNPFGVPAAHDVFAVLGGVGYIVTIFLSPAAIVALVVRFRRSTGIERAQLKWFVASVAPLIVAFAVTFVSYGEPSLSLVYAAASGLAALAIVAVPVAIGIAILRYRLYEIDRIISRTIAYGALTLILALVYVSLVIALQQIPAQLAGGDTLAVAASTLVAAALFQPLRNRLRDLVDRRFHRTRYDAGRTVAEFAERLRDEVDLDRLNDDILVTLNLTLAPAHASLWLCRTDPPRQRRAAR